MQTIFFLVITALLCVVADAQNNRPIIGILTQPLRADPSKAYLVAAYVKWLEAAGARVVAVPYNSTQAELGKLFSNLNALVFTGGGQYLKRGTPYFDAAEYLFNLTMDANKKGDYFPLFGTCMVLHILVSNCGDEQYILERYDSWDISYPLNFTKEAAASRMFRNAPSFVIETLQSAPVTMNYHRYGIAPSAYSTSFPVLQQFFSVLSTNVDNQYKQFVSTVEAKEYPIYGTQWHSEVPIYEFEPSAANHSFQSVIANSYMAHFFVSEARKNMHAFADKETESKTLIYNFCPAYTAATNSNEQTYYF